MLDERSADEAAASAVIGAAIEVHRHLGPGFLESVYEEALSQELRLRGVPFTRQPAVEVGYKGHAVGIERLDFLVGQRLVVELKAIEAILPIHLAQLRSYLVAMNLELGLLINFNAVHLRTAVKRVVNLN